MVKSLWEIRAGSRLLKYTFKDLLVQKSNLTSSTIIPFKRNSIVSLLRNLSYSQSYDDLIETLGDELIEEYEKKQELAAIEA